MEVEIVPRRVPHISQHASGAFFAHVSIVVVSVVAALLVRQPTMIAFGGPSLVLCLAGFAMAQRSEIEVTARFDRPSGVEGDVVTLTVVATPTRATPMLDLELFSPIALTPVGSLRSISAARAGEPVTCEFELTLAEWGLSSPDAIVVNARDSWGMITTRHVFACRCRLRTYLPDPATQSLLDPHRFLRLVGNHNSNDVGGGCELADIRPYRNGDRLRDINWRISARHDEPWVTERHPDRATTVVVVVDASADAGVGQGMLLRRSVRAAMAITQAHLQVNDEVGLAVTGLKNRWLDPQLGRRHAERLSEALLEIRSDALHGHVIDLQRRIPRDAVVIAVSPLLSDDFVQLLKTLRARGQLIHVIEPEIRAAQEPLGKRAAADRSVAARLFAVEQELRRRDLRSGGLSVVHWRLGQPIEAVLAHLERWRHSRSIGALR